MVIFKKENELELKINKYKKITTFSSILRISLAILFVVFMILLISVGDYILYGILSGVSFILFLLSMILTNNFYNFLDNLKRVSYVYESHKRRRECKYNNFTDTGYDLIDKEDYKLLDLDLFGKNSIYQYLNIARTKYGRINLADRLKNKTDDKHFEAVDELSKIEDIVYLEAAVKGFDNRSKSLDYEALYQTLGKKIAINILMFLPLLSFIGMLIYIPLIFTLGLNPYIPIVFLITNIFLCKLFIRNDVFNLDSTSYYNLCDNYKFSIDEINKISFNDPYLNSLKDTLNKNYQSLVSAKSIFNLLATRRNLLFNLVFNMVFVFDFWTLFIYNHKTKACDGLKDLFEAFGEVEALISLSNIGFDNEVSCIPSNSDVIEGEEIYHPLVLNCIPNSFKLDGGVILTGSNMSGKTTFMRTLGLAQTLYNAGGIIPAKSFSSSNLDIYTSLRANDMLSEGISTFYAEILRMKKMNNAIKENKCLILVDEIFKGTNTNDRINASSQVVDKLNSFKQLFIISTHDFELCELSNIKNFHFNEEYIDDKISFDYKIKPGKSETKNAIYLLKMADII